MASDPIRVAVIVLNWNRRDDTLRCLASLAAISEPAIDVILVDNASSDDTLACVAERFPHVRIIRNDANLGFAEGNNVAIRAAVSEGYPFIMLLNNDTVVAPDAIARMLAPLHARPEVGLTSCAITYLHAPGTVWSAGGRIERARGSVTSDWLDVPLPALPAEPYEVDHVSGCVMLLRREAIEDAGVLDPRFFMYYEETEWCARIASHGWRIVVEPAARIQHAIRPDLQLGSPLVAYYMTRNHLLFLRAIGAPSSAWRHTLYWQLRTVGALFVHPRSPERARGRAPMLRALRDFALGRFGPLLQAR